MPICRRRFTTKSDVTLRLRTLVNTFTIRLRLRLSLRLRNLVNMGTGSYKDKGETFTHVEVTTLMLEICVIVNNRPLMDVSCNPDSPLMQICLLIGTCET